MEIGKKGVKDNQYLVSSDRPVAEGESKKSKLTSWCSLR
jgi:hypothetical protein